ncbi:hypothetical protein VM98_10030 [Streptomyces rubellomurinus subsp. indigoferus]|nr:hypothetical protein VM98_10030 [Streptomyces rubellomurinus subsp. indigoferus]
MGIRSKSAAVVVLAALALTTTACDDEKKDGGKAAAPAAPAATAAATAEDTPSAPPAKVTPAIFLEKVTERTGAAKSAKIDESITIGATTIKGKGAASWAHGLQADITMDVSGSPLAKTLEPVTGGPSVHYLYTDIGMYMKLGPDASAELGGHRWLRYTKEDLAKATGAQTTQFTSMDPVQGVRALIAGGKVTEVGQDTVNGKAATHYTGELDLADMIKVTGSSVTQEQIEKIKQGLTANGVTHETLDVWVDADMLVVKRVEQADTKAGALNVTVGYSDYGTPVLAAEPYDYVDMRELQKHSEGATAS